MAIRAFVQNNPGALPEAVVAWVGGHRGYILAKLAMYVRLGAMTGTAESGFTWNDAYVVLPHGGGHRKGVRLQGFKAAARAAKTKGRRVPIASLAELARKHCGDEAAVITPYGHVLTALDAFEQTIDMDSLEPFSRAAWKSLRESVALAGRA
jgi:hypothetical protein